MTIFQVLADPKNRAVSGKFFRFTFLMIFLPLGFLLASIKARLMSVEASAIVAVVLVNVIMITYAVGAYREEVSDYKQEAVGTKKVD